MRTSGLTDTNSPTSVLPLQPIKSKSVTGRLNEAVRATLCGILPTTDIATSGSGYDIDSKSFADMIYGYEIIDQDGSQGECSPSNFTEDCRVDAEGSNMRAFNPLLKEQLYEILEGISSSSSAEFEFEKRLVRDSEKAVALAQENLEQKSCSSRFVMNILRLAGYNAAVCRSRWEKTTAHPAGDYEFIDVVIEGSKAKNERYFVDINFRSQFEIARPTEEYNALLQQLPTLFVGRTDKLCGIIKIMCYAARRSLIERGMCIPPWRKYRYMQLKWAGPYKRSTNPTGSRAAQDTCNEQGGLFPFPVSGSELKAIGWDGSVVYQMEKGNCAADRNLSAKLKYERPGIVLLECPHRLLNRSGQQYRPIKKISGLSTALAEVGLTPSSPCSNETQSSSFNMIYN